MNSEFNQPNQGMNQIPQNNSSNQNDEYLQRIKNQYNQNLNNNQNNDSEKVDYEVKKSFVKDKMFYPSKKDEEIIRILNTFQENKTPFDDIAYFHFIKIGYNYHTLYCPKHNDGEKCPLCEKSEKLSTAPTKEEKDKSYLWKAKKYYMVKILDTLEPYKGVKIWRIPHHSKGKGDYDKIIALYGDWGILDDPYNGRNIKISMQPKQGKSNKYTPISIGPVPNTSPIAQQQENLEKIKNEVLSLHWKDVFTFYEKPNIFLKDESRFIPYDEYLNLFAQGRAPQWDGTNKKFFIPLPINNETPLDINNNQQINNTQGSTMSFNGDNIKF